MLNRRRFLQTVTAGMFAGPLGAQAQPSGKVYRISNIAIELPTVIGQPGQGPFWDRMRELGWVYGQNVVIEQRAFGADSEHVPQMAKELIALGTDVFLANN